MLCSRVILGLGLGCTFVGVLYIVQIEFPGSRFAFFSYLSQSVANIATGALTLFGGSILSNYSYTIIFNILSALLILAALLMVLVLPGKPVLKTSTIDEVELSLANQLRIIFSQRYFWFATVYFTGVFGTILTFADLFNVKYQMAIFNLSTSDAIVLNGMIVLGLSVGGVITGFLSSKFHKSQLIASICSLILFITMIIMLYVKYPFNHRYAISIVVHLIFGLGCGGSMLAFQEIHKAFKDAIRPLANSLVLTIAYLLSGIFLQPVIGMLIGNPVIKKITPFEVDFLSEPSVQLAWHEYNNGLVILVVILFFSFLSSLFFSRHEQPT